MKARSKIIIFTVIFGLSLLAYTFNAFAESSGGDSGGTSPSGTCSGQGNCISGATFVRHEQDDDKYPNCIDYDYAIVLESTYAKTATNGRANKPTGNSRPFRDVINGTTYKGAYGYYKSWSEADAAFHEYDINGGHLSDHPSWTYFCAKPNKPATLTYNANGGSNAPSSQTCYIIGTQCQENLTISSKKPSRSNHIFAGWSNSSMSSSVDWVGGNTIRLSADKTIYAVWLKSLTAHSKSSVSNTIDAKSVTEGNSDTLVSYGGSRNDPNSNTKSYDYYFVHQLKVDGDASKSAPLTYTIERSENGGTSWTTIVNNASVNIAGNNTYVEVRGYSDSKSTFTLTQGQTSNTVCERITYKSTGYTFPVNSTTGTANNTSASSTVCTRIVRRSPSVISIGGNADLYVDAINNEHKNPTNVIYSTNDTRSFTYKLNITAPEGRTLGTSYTIQQLTYNSGETKDWSRGTNVASKTNIGVNAPISNITNSFNVPIAEGTTKTVCERTILNPYRYEINYQAGSTTVEDGSPSPIAGQTIVGERCITIGRPKLTPRNDGEITVYSESSGQLNDNTQADVYDRTQGTWLIKTASANITYTHKLWRDPEKHDGDGVHQADVTSPAEDVTVRYLFADPATNFEATSIDSTHSSTIATNTVNNKYAFDSNPNDNLLNANTTARAETVGVKNEYCQSISYVSEKYTLRGVYWEIDGQIFANNPYLQGTQSPVSQNTVGKSTKACVNVIRPYNFKINSIEPSAETKDSSTSPVSTGREIEAKFTIGVGKNDPSYMLTDIPQSDVRQISFVLNDIPTNGSLTGGKAASGTSPCDFFRNKLGGAMDSSPIACSDSSSGQLPSHTGNSYYQDNSYTITYSYPAIIPNLPTNKKYCLAIAVNPNSSNPNGSYGFTNTLDTGYTISNATCYNIGKYPSMQVWGGSIYTNGGTNTSTTVSKFNNTNTTFGSWDDYMIIAKGKINNTASGAALISGTANFSDCNISPLTVSNSSCREINDKLGNSNVEIPDRIMSGIRSRYIEGTGEYTTLTEMSGNSYIINRSVLNSALSYYPIIFYNNDSSKGVYISQNLETGFTTRAYNSFVIPQIIIYTTGNIYIDPGVGRVDAWLLTDGEIYTCADANGANIRTTGDSGKCDNRLYVTGPVVAKKVHFDRTYGGDAYIDGAGNSSIKEPAEIFDLNPGAYLFGANESTDDAQPIVTYIHELPPRY